jgi:hypothetical protein
MIPTGEVVTMATDYLLAATAFAAAMWLWKTAAGAPGRWWAVAFLASGVAAVLGGTSHGYAPVLDKQTHGIVWRLTYVTVGVANFCILYGAARAALPRPFLRGALALLLLRLLAVATALVLLAQMRHVIYDYTITLVGLIGLAALRGGRGRPGAGWVMAGVAVSLVGAVFQVGRIGEGRVFNHNDVFHVLQAIGIALYARGGRDLGDTEVPVVRLGT